MKLLFNKTALIALIAGLLLSFTRGNDPSDKKHRYPEWAKNAVIYEVDIRQHTDEGTFLSLIKDLPRLRRLGADILWLRPIHPIGEYNRKGKLGSYYSVKDYTDVNPEFGSKNDFSLFMKAAHEQSFKIILDWVPNHSAWDNPWRLDHPEWYKKDADGRFVSPADRTDVISLDYSNRQLRAAMTEAMLYWITAFDIDGFRCDNAALVPKDFWESTRVKLQKTKAVFMVAGDEDNIGLCRKAFDMNEGRKMNALMATVAKGEAKPAEIIRLQRTLDSLYPGDVIKMNFINSFDENSGNMKEKFGGGEKAFSVLAYTLPGMPLLYSGQEAGMEKRLRSSDKDATDWGNTALFDFYKRLNELRHEKDLLWSPPYGGDFKPVNFTGSDQVLAFARTTGSRKIIVIINLSSEPASIRLTDKLTNGKVVEFFSVTTYALGMGTMIDLPGWGYKVMMSR